MGNHQQASYHGCESHHCHGLSQLQSRFQRHSISERAFHGQSPAHCPVILSLCGCFVFPFFFCCFISFFFFFLVDRPSRAYPPATTLAEEKEAWGGGDGEGRPKNLIHRRERDRERVRVSRRRREKALQSQRRSAALAMWSWRRVY